MRIYKQMVIFLWSFSFFELFNYFNFVTFKRKFLWTFYFQISLFKFVFKRNNWTVSVYLSVCLSVSVSVFLSHNLIIWIMNSYNPISGAIQGKSSAPYISVSWLFRREISGRPTCLIYQVRNEVGNQIKLFSPHYIHILI